MPQASDYQNLSQLLTQQLKAAHQLHELLGQERQALDGRDAEKVRHIAEQKNTLVTQLNTLSEQQNTLLIQLGLSADKAGMLALIQAAPDKLATTLDKLYGQLSEILKNCQDMNNSNGLIITAGRQSAEAALAILRGQVVGEDNPLYGAQGEQLSGDKANTIAKA